MTHTFNTSRRRRAGWAAGRVLPVVSGMLLALSLGACDSKRVLQVTDPDVAKPISLAGSAALGVIYAGAVGDFAVGYGGNTTTEGELGYSALITDEYLNSETFPSRIEIDQRNTTPDNSNIVAVFRATQKARASADFASTKIAVANPNDVRRSETMSLAGFMIDMMGEDYCSGSPISVLTDAGAVVFGAPQTAAQLWDDAIAKFDSAITIATANGTAGVTQLNLARVGKARALVNKGDYAGAAVVVGATGPSGAAVPTNFVYLVLYSINTSRENNGPFFWNEFTNPRFSATDKEGINGLPYRSDGDPRTAQKLSGVGFDGVTPQWLINQAANTWAPQGKYPVRNASIPLATGLEARLIEAEAALAVNSPVGYLAAINAEQTAQGVTLSTLPATPAAQVDLLFKERAYTLWFTAHRLGDMRRLIRQYGRNSETVFPTGTFFHAGSASGSYGTDVNIILPNQEKNNPNFTGCIDRAA